MPRIPLLATVLFLVATPSALAADIYYETDYTTEGGHKTLTYQGGDGVNDVAIADPQGTNIVFTSNVTMTRDASAASVCTPASGTTITCETSNKDVTSVTMAGGTGNDTLTLTAAAGNDVNLPLHAIGNGGADTLTGAGAGDVLRGGLVVIGSGEADGADTLNGNGGNDVISGDEGKDILSGDGGGDELHGGGDDDTLNGDAGNDTLFGDGGSDSLDGGTQDDLLIPGAGFDALVQGGGQIYGDTVSYDDGRAAGVTVDLSTVAGSDGDPNEDALGIEFVTGSPHADTLTGNSGGNVMRGLGGDDTMTGGAGSDSLDGGAGADHIVADDTEYDALDCGSEVDKYRADAGDKLTACETDLLAPPAQPQQPQQPAQPSLPEQPSGQPSQPTGQTPQQPTAQPQPQQPLAKATGKLSASFAKGRVKRLKLTGLVPGSTVKVTCLKKCKLKITRKATKSTLDLTAALKAKKLAKGAKLQIRVEAPGRDALQLTKTA